MTPIPISRTVSLLAAAGLACAGAKAPPDADKASRAPTIMGTQAAPAAAPARQAAPAPAPAPAPPAPTAADAKAFVAQVNDELKRLSVRVGTAEWVKNTYITDDTERNAAAMNEDLMAYLSKTIPEAARF